MRVRALDAAVTEKEFQAVVVEYAQRLGYMVYHTYDSRRSQRGFPDLVMVKEGRLVLAIGARDTERYELLTSAGYFCDLVIEHDLLALNDMLQDQRIDAAYRDSMRNTIKSLVSLGEQRTAQAPERWYAPLREVG